MTTIQHYRSTTAGHVPSSLLAGQIGINHTDGLLFYQNPAGAVASRSLRDYGVLIASGSVTSVANITLSIDPAVIGIFRGFLARVSSIPSATGDALAMVFGTSGGIISGSSNYAYAYVTSDASTTAIDWGGDNGTGGIPLGSAGGPGSTTETTDAEVLLSTNDPTPTLLRCASWESVATNTANTMVKRLHGHGWINSDIDITQIQFKHWNGSTMTKAKYQLIGLL